VNKPDRQKEAWTISQTENVKGDKIKALALAKECYAMRLELLTNATVVDDAIRFVASNTARTTDKISSDMTVVVNGGNHSPKEQQSIATTNSVF